MSGIFISSAVLIFRSRTFWGWSGVSEFSIFRMLMKIQVIFLAEVGWEEVGLWWFVLLAIIGFGGVTLPR